MAKKESGPFLPTAGEEEASAAPPFSSVLTIEKLGMTPATPPYVTDKRLSVRQRRLRKPLFFRMTAFASVAAELTEPPLSPLFPLIRSRQSPTSLANGSSCRSLSCPFCLISPLDIPSFQDGAPFGWGDRFFSPRHTAMGIQIPVIGGAS